MSNTAQSSKEVKGYDATPSDTESIAFAKGNTVTFQAGKVVGRKGRRVKTTRINWGLAGEADAFQLRAINGSFRREVDASGNPFDVRVLQSSGSSSIDEPAKTALYAWWFEPEKDKDGHPTPDFWVVTIN